MAKLNIQKHPGILHAVDMQTICQPLSKLGITYFGHVIINKAAEFSALSNNPRFIDHYFTQRYFNADIHLAKSNTINQFCLWDSVNLAGRSAELYRESADFGVCHTFTLHQPNGDEHEYFHFATSKPNPSINQIYLSNLDLLKRFIWYFKERVNQSKILMKAYQFNYSLASTALFDAEQFSIDDKYTHLRQEFLSETSIEKKLLFGNGKILSKMDIDILFWMHQGKTVHDISRLLNVAEVTINKHISNMKRKFGCYTQFQLGEKFNMLFPNNISGN